MNVLVTGASGYVGLHVVDAFLRGGHRVTAVCRRTSGLAQLSNSSQLTLLQADLGVGDVPDFTSHDALVHGALIWGDEQAEVEGHDASVAAGLFDAAGVAGVKRMVFLSSAAVHRPFSGTMDENTPLRPTGLYGATKAAGELFLRSACARHDATGVSLRLGPVVGPPAVDTETVRSPNILLDFMKAATAGNEIEVVRGEGRQFVSGSSVASAVVNATLAEHPDETYLCMDRTRLLWEEVAGACIEQLNSHSILRVVGEPAREVPQFSTDRIEALVGKRLASEEAMSQHLARLAETHRR